LRFSEFGALMNTKRRQLVQLAAGLALGSAAQRGYAQSWPAKPLRIVHGYDSGSNPDTISRLLGPAVGERLSQPVIVESKPGAAGRIAARYVASQPGDGYTFLMLTAGDAVVAALDSKVPFKLLQDFAFVSSVIEFPFLFCVAATSPIKTLQDLLADARRRPGQVSYGTPGIGTTHSLAGDLLKHMTGLDLLHIPYKGNAFPDLIGGRVDFLIATPSVSLPLIQGGKIRAIAVTSKEALAAVADATPVDRAVPGFEVKSWLGLAAPAATPAAVVQRMSSVVQAAAAVDSVRANLAGTGSLVVTSSGEAFRVRVEADVKKWSTFAGRVKLES
jgi:tripartite-type tricarboxylate transporter receptor subunit TctC